MPLLNQPAPTFWPQKAQITNSLNSILVTKGRNFIINFVTLRLTKVKFSKIISFFSFLTQIRQKLGPDILQMWHFCLMWYICLKFPLFVQPLLFALKVIPQCKIWKKLFARHVSLLFSWHWTKFCLNFAPRPQPLWYFFWFPMKYVKRFN